MVSFRDHQFRAVLLGLIMADAVSWGVLPGIHQPQLIDGEPSPQWQGARINSDRWCRQLVTQFRQPEQIEEIDAIALEPLYTADAIESLLSLLPEVLLAFDRSSGLEGRYRVWYQQSDAAAIIFYQSLKASLDEDLMTLQTLRVQSIEMAQRTQQPLAQAVHLALEQSCLAQGDFNLSVGQSLFSPSRLAGLPLLTGILSAARVGMAGLPLSYQHALAAPVPNLRDWLHHRWQITTAAAVHQWAQSLWQQWLGGDIIASQAALGVAVRPAQPMEW